MGLMALLIPSLGAFLAVGAALGPASSSESPPPPPHWDDASPLPMQACPHC